MIPPILVYTLAVLRRADANLERRVAKVLNGPPEEWASKLYGIQDELEDAGEEDDEPGDDARCTQIVGEIVARIGKQDRNLYKLAELGTMYSDALLNAEHHYNAPGAKCGDAVVDNGVWWVYGVYDFADDEPLGEAAARMWSALFTAWLTGGMAAAVALTYGRDYTLSLARQALVTFATWERAAEATDEGQRQSASHAKRRITALLTTHPLGVLEPS